MKNDNRRVRRTVFAKCFLLTLIVAFAIIPQTGCGKEEPVSKTDFCLNTVCEIKIYDMDQQQAEQILTDAYQEIRRLENLLSKTVENSDIYRINHAEGEAVSVSEETLAVIEQGLRMGRLSGGRFDITIGGLTDLWDFNGEDPHVPSRSSIEEALSAVDDAQVVVDGSQVRLENPEGQLDLGGIAKGYIADRIGEWMEAQGVERAIINLGGNVVALGDGEDGNSWNIGIERPYSDRTELVGSIAAEDVTVVTSGIYERNFEEKGVLYHHILDPQTGFPVETDLESVTLTAAKGNSAFCDGLSTVCIMLGQQQALELIQQLQQEYPEMGLEAAFIDKNDDIVQTDGMNLQITEQ